ncbi:MAG: SDR family NAD(P)-dependent oxidoreductase [Oscillospiraceae bacterium]
MLNNRLEGKVAIVTGSTSGIGIGIAKIFAQSGAKVVVTGRRKEKGEAVVSEILNDGGAACYFYSDIEKPESVENLIKSTVEKYGKLDILVNNASNVALKDGTIEELTIEMWDAIMESDLRSAFLATKYALPYMRKTGAGSIVNIGSTASCSGDLGAAAYASAKAGINLLTLSTSLQYGKENIRCNCIRPGLIITPQNDANVRQEVKDIFVNNIEVNRYGNPADIGYMALFFASDESSYVTGQIINVDGGLNSHTPTVGQFRLSNSKTW